MKNKRYSEEDEDFLRKNYLSMTNKELSKTLDRSLDGIIQKLKEMGLVRRTMNPYSTEEKEFIAKNIDSMSIFEIANKLNRSSGGVSKYVAKYCINRDKKRWRKVYTENIDKDIPPFYSKGQNYYEIISQMEVNDSFKFPEEDRAIVANQKYQFINYEKKINNAIDYVFMIRKIEQEDEESDSAKFCRIWRIK